MKGGRALPSFGLRKMNAINEPAFVFLCLEKQANSARKADAKSAETLRVGL
jgi:hypothetical protein